LAEDSGFCFGVRRAIDMIFAARENEQCEISVIGDIIHNPQVVEDLKRRGVRKVDSVDEIKSGICVIRTHGIPLDVEKQVMGKGLAVLDATCPVVKRSQRLVSKLVESGYQVVIVGRSNHPEVVALLSYAKGCGRAISHPDETEGIEEKKIGLIAQTTISRKLFNAVVSKLLSQVEELRVFNTICRATEMRQESAINLSRSVDFMLVVGGRNSSNTVHLYELVKGTGTPAQHIETADEIDPAWLSNVERVGVTAGASTPDWIINDVLRRLHSLSAYSLKEVNG